jgi:hypothetical protein
MNSLRSVVLTILVCILLAPSAGFAQFRNWDRFELGGSYVMAMGNFSGVSGVTDASGRWMGDTTVKRSITTSIGYGAFIGTCIPFKRLGHESLWAISLGITGNMLTWSDVNSIYGSGGVTKNGFVGSVDATTLQIGIPFGIEYKVGTDAIKSQRSRTGASFGIGFMPVMNGSTLTTVKTADDHNSGFNYGFNPYIKAEVAGYAGICFKLRLMASYGNLNYLFENANAGKYTDGPFRITGMANITGMLILMPFSYRWTEHSWFNTYDTYNPYDKLH